MLKKVLLTSICTILALRGVSYGAGDKTITSKPYVDTQIATKQLKIPAANTAGVGPGDSVITYTNVAGGGVIGERALFTGGEYNASTDADKMITASALDTAFATLPKTDTSKLVCADSPACTLWTIVDQLAYGNACKAYGEETTVESECCSGLWSSSMIDLRTGVQIGECGCTSDSDCGTGQHCDTDWEHICE